MKVESDLWDEMRMLAIREHCDVSDLANDAFREFLKLRGIILEKVEA